MSDEAIKKLESLPKSLDGFVWADYIELLCLTNLDGDVSKSDLLDRIEKRVAVGESSDEGNSEVLDNTRLKVRDKYRRKIGDWFRHLDFRAQVFQEFYPFKVSEDTNSLLRKQRLSPKCKLYVYFLLASYFTEKHVLTSTFEKISEEALKSYLPQGAEVYVFGTSASRSGRYRGNLQAKISKLAKDLRETPRQDVKFSNYNTGDHGLDLVAWFPFNDKNDRLLILLGQCGCTEKWVGKQHSSGFETWNELIAFRTRPNNLAFIPFCFRDPDGTWSRPQDIQGTILVDRLRFIYLLRKSPNLIESLACYTFVQQILKAKEPIF